MNNNITEAACLDFIRSEHSRLAIPKWATISISSDETAKGSFAVNVSGHHKTPDDRLEWVHGSGPTIAQAHAEFCAKLPPAGPALAAKYRADAAKLLAEADALERGEAK